MLSDFHRFGVPTALTALEGKESLKAVEMAVEEINAKGGVKSGITKKQITGNQTDLKMHSPGVPVSEALWEWKKSSLRRK